RFKARLDYCKADVTNGAGMKPLAEHIGQASTIFFLALSPSLYGAVCKALDESGLACGDCRIVLEKPLGHDLESSRAINAEVAAVFEEKRVFRIDHYLGKETVQNLIALRFANTFFEPLWNNLAIDHVQITVAETEGVGDRWPYYDEYGALRDMVQNHMLQVLALTGMEPPVSLASDAVADAKVNVIRSLRPLGPGDVRTHVVRGQYAAGALDGHQVTGYLQEEGVRENSRTETFVALKTMVDNWRWAGVPFYLRTGKRLPRRASAIFVQFKRVPEILFNRRVTLPPDMLAIRIQPDEGFSLEVLAKRPGLDLAIQPVRMDLHYAAEFNGQSPDAYERLLLDVMAGDHTLFLGSRFVQRSWEYVQSILDRWQDDASIPLETYPAGSWGPKAADELIRADGREWIQP
ncbi:MAG TPA: glucose-6-phosphate dehydrogenase, partial [Candidatus Binataceae bacterium]|nr:glucose-6-phosphate dehydrogenase [Candidatus Binataceae bacterium]